MADKHTQAFKKAVEACEQAVHNGKQQMWLLKPLIDRSKESCEALGAMERDALESKDLELISTALDLGKKADERFVKIVGAYVKAIGEMVKQINEAAKVGGVKVSAGASGTNQDDEDDIRALLDLEAKALEYKESQASGEKADQT